MDSTTEVRAVKQVPPVAVGEAPGVSALADSLGASQRPLGNTAKSSPTCDAKTQQWDKRAERYEALSVARFWTGKRMEKVDPDRNPGDVYRVHDCRWARRQRFVEIQMNQTTGTAHYSGLATCGSVWACPICCAVIQERRRVELAQLINWAYENGYKPCMVTFTFPHVAFDRLADLKEKQRDAFNRLRKGNAWDCFKKRNGFDGLVRSLEVVFGRNGWHPHTHEIWLIRDLSEVEEINFVAWLKDRWHKCCVSAGLLDGDDQIKGWHFDIHAVDVRFGVSESDYLAKQDSSRSWGVDRELAKATGKKGGINKGIHPHEFLIRRDKGDAGRYFEYIHAMHGSRQLFWSHGLKDRVGIVDKDDQEAAENQNANDDPLAALAELGPDEWDFIRKQRNPRARAHLLQAAESGGLPEVRKYLISLGWDPYR